MRRHAVGAGLLTVLLLASCSTSTGGEPVATGDAGQDAGPAPSTSVEQPADDPCAWVESPAEPAPVGLPPNDGASAARVVLATSAGELPIALTPDETPCTVRSFSHLASEGFYDDTSCHRLTTSAGLKVLQCGDPKGNGTGGPGYTIPDELPTDLPDAPTDASGQQVVTYPRGTVAMANAGPETGGSQFFLVYGDSTLPPSYAVFGTVDETGLATLDAVAADGVAPGGNSPEDGAPVLAVDITSVTVD